jgi:hypothetical protein
MRAFVFDEVLGGGLGFLLSDLIRWNVFRTLHKVRPEILSKSGDHPSPLERIERLDRRLQIYFSGYASRSRETLAPLKPLQWVAMDLTPP